jgi:hypothetical protein
VRRSQYTGGLLEALTGQHSWAEFVELAADRAESAGARWEPEPEPAAEMPAELHRQVWHAIRDSVYRPNVYDDARLLAEEVTSALAPLFNCRQPPAGPGRERKLAVPLVMTSVEGAIWDGNGNLVLDASLGWERREKIGSLKTTNPDTLSELVNHYNAPPAPAGWPAPRLGREGLPAKGLVLWWNTVEWAWLHVGCIEPNDRWLPGPPPLPKAP